MGLVFCLLAIGEYPYFVPLDSSGPICLLTLIISLYCLEVLKYSRVLEVVKFLQEDKPAASRSSLKVFICEQLMASHRTLERPDYQPLLLYENSVCLSSLSVWRQHWQPLILSEKVSLLVFIICVEATLTASNIIREGQSACFHYLCGGHTVSLYYYTRRPGNTDILAFHSKHFFGSFCFQVVQIKVYRNMQ